MISEDIKDILVRAGYKDFNVTVLPEVIIISTHTFVDEGTRLKILSATANYIKIIFDTMPEKPKEIKVKKIPKLLKEWWQRTKIEIEKNKDIPKDVLKDVEGQ